MSIAKILIVEDEPSLQNALKDKLEKEDFEVITASNGQEGLEAIKSSSPSLVLLDMVMPIMDGLAMLRNLREGGSKDLPVIILSNLSDSQDILKAMENETFDYLVKSDVSLEEIIKKVKDKLNIS